MNKVVQELRAKTNVTIPSWANRAADEIERLDNLLATTMRHYEQLREIIDDGCESSTHEDAVETLKNIVAKGDYEPELRLGVYKEQAELRKAREQVASLEQQRYALIAGLELFMEVVETPPERSCSCHISPPCNDCVNNSGLREAFEFAKEAIAKAEG